MKKRAKKTATRVKRASQPATAATLRKHIRAQYKLLLQTAYTLIGGGEGKPPTARVEVDSYEIHGLVRFRSGSWYANVYPENGDANSQGYATRNGRETEHAALAELSMLLQAIIETIASGFGMRSR